MRAEDDIRGHSTPAGETDSGIASIRWNAGPPSLAADAAVPTTCEGSPSMAGLAEFRRGHAIHRRDMSGRVKIA